jgi:heme/copper-type cytochrome/quinol oxidase subunit 2
MKKTFLAVLIFGILTAITYALSRDSLPEATAHTVTITDCEAVTDGELVFDAGDEVTLLVTADQDAQFHIHGYDLMRELTAGMEERIVFQAMDPGRYEYELEEICHLGELTVRAADGTIPEAAEGDGHVEGLETEEDHEE